MNVLKPARKNVIILLYVVIQISYLFSEYNITSHQFGVPLDDVWIHFRYAENIVSGNFFQFNIGEPTPGTTSPMWSIIMSIPFLFSQNFFLFFALLISSVFFLFALLELYKLCIKLGFNENFSMLITLLTMLSGRLLWASLSGMETTLFVFFCILIVKNHTKELEKSKLLVSTGLLLGIAGVTRPEAYLLAAVYYFTSVILLRKNFRENIYPFIISAGIFIAVILPYIMFSYYTSGSLTPNKYKQLSDASYLPDIQYLIQTGLLLVNDNLAVVLLWFGSIGFFIFQLLRRRIENKFLLIYLWVIIFPAVSSVIAPVTHHHGRYLLPLVPFINIVSIHLFKKICDYLSGKGFKIAALYRRLGMAVLIIFSIRSTVVFGGLLGWNVENVNSQQVKIGKWLAENLPNEKAFGMNDIGAISFFTKKNVVDMAGLVTPEIFKFVSMSQHDGANSMMKLLKEKGVNYIIIYPDWFEYIMMNYKSYFTQVYSAKLEKNTICGGIEMFVYKINWDKLPLDK